MQNEEDISTEAVVQPANKERINPDIIDWSLEYLQVHSKITIVIDDRLTWQGKKYKAVELGNYVSYGFYEALFEQVK